jgi:hypothetical protein
MLTIQAGITPSQLNDLIRKDKGSLRKAFNGFIETM